MTPTLVFLLPALVFAATVVEARSLECAPHRFNTLHAQAVTDFTMAVNRYAEIHRLLADPMSALAHADLEQAARARRAHRAAVLEALGTLRYGDVFTPRVAARFRCEIELVERHSGTEVAAMWPRVLLALPDLPKELEYRLVGRDLVLLDRELNLVVDVLEAAFPLDWAEDVEAGDESETCVPEEPPIVVGSPCDAHSELEICWS